MCRKYRCRRGQPRYSWRPLFYHPIPDMSFMTTSVNNLYLKTFLLPIMCPKKYPSLSVCMVQETCLYPFHLCYMICCNMTIKGSPVFWINSNVNQGRFGEVFVKFHCLNFLNKYYIVLIIETQLHNRLTTIGRFMQGFHDTMPVQNGWHNYDNHCNSSDIS